MDRTKINIAACFDRGFVMPTGVMIYSVCANNPDVDIDFHLVVDESVSEGDKNDLMNTIGTFRGKTTFFYEINSQYSSAFPIYIEERLTRSTYYRLCLAEILPQKLEKVLYLDGDCIVRRSLLSLWDIDVSNYAIGAVLDVSGEKIEFYNRLRYPRELGYFNAGVLLINLDYWRRNNIQRHFLDFIESHLERIMFEDQDVLNVVFHDKKLFLPVKYNFQMNFLLRVATWDYWKHEKEMKEAIADPIIVHYSTMDKPWNTYTHNPHPFNSTFYKYQNQTKWKGMLYEKRSIKQIFINYVGDYLRKIGILAPLRAKYIDVLPVD